MEIREYRPADFDRLYQIDHEAFTEEIAYSHLELQYYLRSRKCRALVAEDSGDIVGFVIGCSEARKLGHIITIDVTPHRQRQQVGSRLLAEIEAWLWQKGAEAIYLETAIDDDGARGFYDKHGYFVLERIEGYYHDTLDAFVMMKTAKRSEHT
ncbi:MAG TPA: N-acetyltransferase [Blastocatellia bacterium]|jgi:ribosomal protein S18 acetylase RimI-like enzyme